ncbi:MAG: HAD-IIIA family hydrolase [Candidatus Omnitrophica bacterium]|nr:HAD-IIIA family hydrolase [Candidatus Omnitrophota bacterium]
MVRTRKLIFLDRDGVINKNPAYKDYIKKPAEFYFLPRARKAIRLLNEAGFDVAIVSNQTGVGKGLFTCKDLKDIDDKMRKGLEASGSKVRKLCYCIHHPESGCDCRKPKTGSFKKAVGKSKVNIKSSFYIGDTQRDVAAGKNFGLKNITVLSGYGKRSSIKNWKAKPDFITKDLFTAVSRIVLK